MKKYALKMSWWLKMINARKVMLLLAFGLVLLLSEMSFLGIDNSFAAVKKTHLKKTKISVVSGKTYQQKLIDKKGKTIKATKVKWKSKKTSVAKISKKGKITAVKAGTVKMTAKYKGKTYKFTVKVKPFSSNAKPTITGLHIYRDNYGPYLKVEWKGLKNAMCYRVYISKEGGPYSLYTIEGKCQSSFRFNDITKSGAFKISVKIVAQAGSYKSKYSNAESIYLIGGSQNLYDYVMSRGEPFSNSYIPGDYYISTQSTRYDSNGKKCIDTYIISADHDETDRVYFGLYTIKEDPKLTPDHYTQEFVYVCYDDLYKDAIVNFKQQYWWDLAGKQNWSYYFEKCAMQYAAYDGNTNGLSDFRIGRYDEENTNSQKEIISRTTLMMRGINDMLKGNFNQSLYVLGFKRMS